MCPVVYAFESSVSSQNDFHLENWKAMIVEISLHAIYCFEIYSTERRRLIVVELRHKDLVYLFWLRGLEKKHKD